MLDLGVLAERGLVHPDEMDHRLVAAIVPGAGEAEGRPRPFAQPEDVTVEARDRFQVGGADIDVIEPGHRHRRISFAGVAQVCASRERVASGAQLQAGLLTAHDRFP